MVRSFAVVLIALCMAIPALAQDDDYPRIQTTVGYANLAFDDGATTSHHSGFAMFNALNLTRSIGLENFTGIWGLGDGVTLLSNIVGGKMLRSDRAIPYFVAGIGAGYASSGQSYSGTMLSARLGGGIDIPLGDAVGFKFDASRVSFRSGGWFSNWNFVTGVTFNVN
jgi:hypothetical protein